MRAVLSWELSPSEPFSLLYFFFALDPIISFGSNPYLLSTAAFLGTLMGSWITFQRVRFIATIALLIFLFFLVQFGFHTFSYYASQEAESILFPFAQFLHFRIAFIVFLLSYLSAWLFWKATHAVTLELISLASFLVYIFSGHRDFHFSQAPPIVGDIAWLLGTDHLTVLIVIGALTTLLLSLYLWISTLPWKPRTFSLTKKIRTHTSSPRLIGGALVTLIFVILVGGISRQIFFQYYQEALTRGSNGVGFSESSEESVGKSPLGFHSALGSNSQPAGLVRLDGDYSENPFSPMLYLREGALSEYNGTELVEAGKAYDDDLVYLITK